MITAIIVPAFLHLWPQKKHLKANKIAHIKFLFSS